MASPDFESLDSGGGFPGRCVLAIGIFDALHRGHSRVLSEAARFAGEKSAELCVLTFFPHPAEVLGRSGEFRGLICPPGLRARLLKEAGASRVFFKDFDADFASRSPEEFVEFLREKFPGAVGVVTGENFRFGRGAAAGVSWLARRGADFGIEARAVAGVAEDGLFVSSTRLRRALCVGDMGEFERLAGRPYFAEGEVSGGKRLGRRMGFPTLNLYWNPDCRPPFGVYVSRLANLETGKVYDGVSSYGTNPTVENSAPVVETNLFPDGVDFGEGTRIRVEFLKMLRPEKKFASVDDLKSQIARDKSAAADFFGALE